MVVAILLTVAGLVMPTVQSDSALRKIQTMVARPAVMCGEFEQRKTLLGLQHPVRSTGRFCVMAERGVLWTTQSPFPSTLRLTRAEIVESRGDHVTSRLSAKQEPAVGMISDLLFSVLAGDFMQLRVGFTISASAESAAWHAKLVPKDAGLRRVIRSIELGGAEFVRQITIAESSGDQTAIAFTNVTSGLGALKPEEVAAFGVPAGRGSHQN